MENNEPSIEVPCWNCGLGNRPQRQEGVRLYRCANEYEVNNVKNELWYLKAMRGY
jgi:hypothetical protein